MRLGGDKLAAKRIAREAGVPVLPDGTPDEIGFPLVVKAAAGGGGRGMRVVRSREELDDALAAAEREATAAFGDGTLYCERYLERPRHVEVQLLADTHGTVVALGERDCSVQRRHQKVLEEAPAPGLSPALRASLHEAAVAFGHAIGYCGAGTVEFVLDGDDFFFLELNGRIQVEHPVTEAVTGLDLVERQIRVAEGEALAGDANEPTGHAVEVRLYAEDPRTFLPQTGRIDRLELPGFRSRRHRRRGGRRDRARLRPDDREAHRARTGPGRGARPARGRARRDRRRGCDDEPRFPPLARRQPGRPAGEATTAFLTEHPPLSPPAPSQAPGPFRAPWRLNLPAPPPASPPDIDIESQRPGAAHGESTVTAPMPGTVIRVEVAPGDEVRARQPLVVLEAMKMEIPVHSPFGGTVKAVHVVVGDRVAGGTVVVELESY